MTRQNFNTLFSAFQTGFGADLSAAPAVPSVNTAVTPAAVGTNTAFKAMGDGGHIKVSAPAYQRDEAQGATRSTALVDKSNAYFDQQDNVEREVDSNNGADLDGKFPGVTFGTDAANVIFDGDEDQTIYGLGGDDLITAGAGSDVINGGAGDDKIFGGSGQDILEGGSGNDILTGGQDIDVFVWRKGDGVTTITDFELGFDIIDLEDFGSVSYDELVASGTQVGDDIHFEIGIDTLIMQNADLETLTADDLCIR